MLFEAARDLSSSSTDLSSSAFWFTMEFVEFFNVVLRGSGLLRFC